MENEQHGLTANLTDSWTPEQRQQFLTDWNNNEWLWQVCEGQLCEETCFVDNGEPILQTGRGEKRQIDEVNDGASTS